MTKIISLHNGFVSSLVVIYVWKFQNNSPNFQGFEAYIAVSKDLEYLIAKKIVSVNGGWNIVPFVAACIMLDLYFIIMLRLTFSYIVGLCL